MAMPNITAQNSALNASIAQLSHSAHAAGQDVEQLSKSVIGYGKALLALGSVEAAKMIVSWGWHQLKQQDQQILRAKEQLIQRKMMVTSLKAQLDFMKTSGLYTQEQIKEQTELVSWMRKLAAYSRDEVGFRTKVLALIKEQGPRTVAAVGYLLLLRDAWQHTLEIVHTYSRALITADSNAASRYRLIYRTLAVQQTLGASTEDMAEAARALVEHGNHLTPAYQTNLKLVVQMKQGLGVAAQSAAEMVVIFTRQLKTSAQEAADQVARIAYNTGLAAQKMTQYAAELGKAVRLLGTGSPSSPSGVLKAVGTIAGRVEALGGNSQSIINLYRSMVEMSGTGIQARALGRGINANLGTEGGAQKVFENLAAVIDARTRGLSNPMRQVAMAEWANQVGISQNELVDLIQVMKEWNTTTNSSRTLEQAYVDQTNMIGESWKQIKASLGTLISQALLPFAYGLQRLFAAIATTLKAVASWTVYGWNPFALVLTVALPAAAIVAVIALKRLTVEIVKMALQSRFAMSALQIPGISGFGRFLPTLPGSAALPWARFFTVALGWTAILTAIAVAADQIHKAFIEMRIAQEKEKQTRFNLMQQQTSFTKLALDKAIASQVDLKATPEEREASLKKAVALLLKEPRAQPWTPEEARQMILRRSLEAEKKEARLEQLRGLSIKSKEEIQHDEAMRIRMQTLAAQLKSNEHAAKAAEEDRKKNQWQLDFMRDYQKLHYWQMSPNANGLSNGPAYAPSPGWP